MIKQQLFYYNTSVDTEMCCNETMFGSGYENCPEFGVLGGGIFKIDIL
jgi:hypothetical protein